MATTFLLQADILGGWAMPLLTVTHLNDGNCSSPTFKVTDTSGGVTYICCSQPGLTDSGHKMETALYCCTCVLTASKAAMSLC
jgi:hypothetical protein